MNTRSEQKITPGKIVDGAMLVGGLITSPFSLFSETLKIPYVKNKIRRYVIKPITLTSQEQKTRKREPSVVSKGATDVVGIVQSMGDTIALARRNIAQEVEQAKNQTTNKLRNSVEQTNEDIFRDIKRTTGYTIGMVTDIVFSGGVESVTGVPIPGVSALRDHLLANNPFLQSAEPKFFVAAIGLTAVGLITGGFNVIRNTQYARGVNKTLIERNTISNKPRIIIE